VLDSEFVPHARIKQWWSEVTHGSTIVDIRSIKSVHVATRYVARYVSRPANLHDYETDDAVEIIRAFASRRLVGTWGTAAEADLTGKKDWVRSDWVYLGSWLEITREVSAKPYASAVLYAWQSGHPVDPQWLESITPNEVEHNHGNEMEPDPMPKQLWLWDVRSLGQYR
jgi:hypothetical protein